VTETAAGPGMRETVLTIEGMTCAACAARVEKKLNGLQGVSVAVNYATATARVAVPAEVTARELVTAVEQAGYAAREPAGGQDAARQAADLKRRLIVALVFFVPLTDLSLMLSLIPSLRLVGLRDVRPRSRRTRRQLPAATDSRPRRRDLPGNRRHGHHVPAGRACSARARSTAA
jgi:cation transport ATPase